MGKILITFLIFCFLAAPFLRGEIKSILAEKFVWEKNEEKMLFEGKVKISMERLSLKADKVTLWWEKDQLKEVRGEGEVVVKSGSMSIITGKFTYSPEDKVIHLERGVSLRRENMTLEGERGVIYVEEDKVYLEGGVKAEIQ